MTTVDLDDDLKSNTLAAVARAAALNCVVDAYEDATAITDGPMAGLAYLTKDLDDECGRINRKGSRAYHQASAAIRDFTPTARVRAAGALLIGRTNTPEFGLLPNTEPLLHGPVRNPYNPAHDAGGSSGGAAAAVAAGIVRVAQAGDGGGSIRIPASACNIFGLKPSRGRIAYAPDDGANPIVTHLGVSRTVRDSALLLAVTEDRAGPLPPVGLIETDAGLPRRRCALVLPNSFGDAPQPDVARAVTSTALLLESLGHHVEEIAQPLDGRRFIDSFMVFWSQLALAEAEAARDRGQRPDEVLEPWTLGLAEMHRALPPGAVEAAMPMFDETAATYSGVLSSFDLLVTPVTRTPPPPLGWLAPSLPFDTLWSRVLDYCSYTAQFNAAGLPAMSIPSGFSGDGLPIGTQIIARAGDEAGLLRLAYEIEAARPWAEDRPFTS